MGKKRILHAVGVYKETTRAQRVYAKYRNPYYVAIVEPKGLGVSVKHVSRARI